MKAAWVKKYNKIKITEVPVAEPRGNEVLVKIDACGVCASDFIEAQAWAKEWKRFGHEIAATVIKTGETVTGFASGDQVVVALSTNCGTCAACTAGYPRKCNQLIVVEQGGFAEYLLIKDYRLLHKVTLALPPELVCLTEPLTVILDAFQLAGFSANDSLLIVGGGNIGGMALLAAKAAGINILGILTRNMDSRLSAILNASGGSFFKWQTRFGMVVDVDAALKRKFSALSGRLVVLHTAPPCYIAKYIKALPYDSAIVNIGLSASTGKNTLTLDASKMVFKRIQLMNAFPVPCLQLAAAVEMIQKSPELFSLISTEKITLEQLPELITGARKSRHKAILVPDSK